jgi:hypothetical protein
MIERQRRELDDQNLLREEWRRLMNELGKVKPSVRI